MESSTTQIPKQAPSENEEITLESVDFFVRMMSIMGLPRSVGEIYGLLYFSEDPLSMDQICKKLGISVGSASQGLKTLRNLQIFLILGGVAQIVVLLLWDGEIMYLLL